jgi:predicted O-methyltransferase YrrM
MTVGTAVHVKTAVALAWTSGRGLDLAACAYGPGAGGRVHADPMRYYHFLAGLARVTRARNIVEVGTHFGGSARALAEGQRAAGVAPNVLTFDVEDRAGAPVLGFDGVARALVDARHPEGAARVAEWAGDEPIDILYIDALKDAEFVETTVAAFSGRAVSWLVIDDIFANLNIRGAWDRIRQEHAGAATTLDEVVLDLRTGGYGQGVVALTGQALQGLAIDPLREAAARRWSGEAAEPDLREAVSRCTGEGEIVVVGANSATARTLARALIARADLGGVSVNVMAGFQGSSSADSSRGPAARRGEPSLAEFRELLGDLATVVNVFAGDVPSLRWPGRPIELLVVGWKRDPTQLAHSWRELLPWCIPGGSLVLVEGIGHGVLGSPDQDLGGLLAHLEVLGVGRSSLALAPVSTPGPEALSSLAAPPRKADWSPLGVPI